MRTPHRFSKAGPGWSVSEPPGVHLFKIGNSQALPRILPQKAQGKNSAFEGALHSLLGILEGESHSPGLAFAAQVPQTISARHMEDA